MRLYKCDKCGEHVGEDKIISGCVMYQRTPEEIKELLKTALKGTSYEMMKAKSVVVKPFDHCKKCNGLVKEFFKEKESKK